MPHLAMVLTENTRSKMARTVVSLGMVIFSCETAKIIPNIGTYSRCSYWSPSPVIVLYSKGMSKNITNQLIPKRANFQFLNLYLKARIRKTAKTKIPGIIELSSILGSTDWLNGIAALPIYKRSGARLFTIAFIGFMAYITGAVETISLLTIHQNRVTIIHPGRVISICLYRILFWIT